jgi:hypothetical protein
LERGADKILQQVYAANDPEKNWNNWH